MEEAISHLAARFKEPSSWAGLTGIALMLHISVDPGILQSGSLIGAGIAGIVAFFLPEK
jgi:hypothetical protein